MLVAVVVVAKTRRTCTGKIAPACTFVKVTSVPCAVKTRMVPPVPEKMIDAVLNVVVSLVVTVAASPGNMGNVGL